MAIIKKQKTRKPTFKEVAMAVAKLRIVKADGFAKEPNFLISREEAVDCVKMARAALGKPVNKAAW